MSDFEYWKRKTGLSDADLRQAANQPEIKADQDELRKAISAAVNANNPQPARNTAEVIDRLRVRNEILEQRLSVIYGLTIGYDGYKGNAEGLESLIDDIAGICQNGVQATRIKPDGTEETVIDPI